MKRVGLGLIGLGFMGGIHLRHSLKLANAHLVAVSDESKKALRKAKSAGVKRTFTDYRQLLKDKEIDSVIIALPTHLHLQCTKEAAEAGKHIFLEKPVARNITEAKEIISVTRSNSVKLMIGYPLRFNPVFWRLKETIRSGILGDIEIAYGVNVGRGPFMHRQERDAPRPVPEWWFNKELSGGGALIDLGCHMINLLQWYFGEITKIRSHLGYRFNLDVEDHAISLAQFKSGASAVINVGWFSQKYLSKVELLGTVNNITAEVVTSNLVVSAIQTMITKSSRHRRPFLNALRYFVNCIADDSPPSPSGMEGLKDLEAIESAYKNSLRLDERSHS